MNENLPEVSYGGEVKPGGFVSIEQSRVAQEVQASMVIAKRFPRDEIRAQAKILKACERRSLAEQAEYAYPRGGQLVTGPSIRLAEVLAQCWENIIHGIQELNRDGNSSELEAYAWDLETNVRVSRKFQASHVRYSKAKGFQDLEDPRDIYEMVANQGARRQRACILQIIPGDIVEAAIAKCHETLSGKGEQPIKDRVVKMVAAFSELGVRQEAIENRLGHPMNSTIEAELANLRKIYTSIKDGVAKRTDFFDLNSGKKAQADLPSLKDRIEEAKAEFTNGPVIEEEAKSEKEEALPKTSWPCPYCDHVSPSPRGRKKHISQSHKNQDSDSEAQNRDVGEISEPDNTELPESTSAEAHAAAARGTKTMADQVRDVMAELGNGATRLYQNALKKRNLKIWDDGIPSQHEDIFLELSAALDAKNNPDNPPY